MIHVTPWIKLKHSLLYKKRENTKYPTLYICICMKYPEKQIYRNRKEVMELRVGKELAGAKHKGSCWGGRNVLHKNFADGCITC